METAIPPDPFETLGVDRSADAAAIKKAYRKLVLNCHPDKVTDESLKAQKQEEFHQIQQAYETIGEPAKRERWELEQKAKKLREEKLKEFASSRRTPTKSSPGQTRHVNVNIYTAHPPPEFRTTPSKHTPSRSTPSAKPYSAEFAKSWEHQSTYTKPRDTFERTRRTVSEEKLKRDRDESRERDRRREESEKEKRRAQKEREQRKEREEEERRRRRREKEERERMARREQEERERAKAKRAFEREREREARRKQEAQEKQRSKTNKYYTDAYSDGDEDARWGRAKKSSKKDTQTRAKSVPKSRERMNPSVEEIPDVPPVPTCATEAKTNSHLSYAADYIINTSTSQPHTTEPKFSPEYPNPADHKFARRTPGDGVYVSVEPVHIVDVGSPPRVSSPTPPQAPPRLQKAHTMGYVPTKEFTSTKSSSSRRVPLGRSYTMEPDFRFSSEEKHSSSRASRGRTSFDENDYRPRVSKYKVSADGGTSRMHTTTPYQAPYTHTTGTPFGKYKQSPPYGLDNLASSQYDKYSSSQYAPPSFSDYRSPYVS